MTEEEHDFMVHEENVRLVLREQGRLVNLCYLVSNAAKDYIREVRDARVTETRPLTRYPFEDYDLDWDSLLDLLADLDKLPVLEADDYRNVES